MVSRREFLVGAGTLAFLGLSKSAMGNVSLSDLKTSISGFGPLLSDPNKLLLNQLGSTHCAPRTIQGSNSAAGKIFHH